MNLPSSPPVESIRLPGRANDLNPLRLLEYSGLLVLLALMTEALPTSLGLTEIVDASNLCIATVYSALSIAMAFNDPG